MRKFADFGSYKESEFRPERKGANSDQEQAPMLGQWVKPELLVLDQRIENVAASFGSPTDGGPYGGYDS